MEWTLEKVREVLSARIVGTDERNHEREWVRSWLEKNQEVVVAEVGRFTVFPLSNISGVVMDPGKFVTARREASRWSRVESGDGRSTRYEPSWETVVVWEASGPTTTVPLKSCPEEVRACWRTLAESCPYDSVLDDFVASKSDKFMARLRAMDVKKATEEVRFQLFKQLETDEKELARYVDRIIECLDIADETGTVWLDCYKEERDGVFTAESREAVKGFLRERNLKLPHAWR